MAQIQFLAQEFPYDMDVGIKKKNKITTKKKEIPIKKTSGPKPFSGEFYQMSKEKIIPVIYKFFQKAEGRKQFPNFFYESRIIITKSKIL